MMGYTLRGCFFEVGRVLTRSYKPFKRPRSSRGRAPAWPAALSEGLPLVQWKPSFGAPKPLSLR